MTVVQLCEGPYFPRITKTEKPQSVGEEGLPVPSSWPFWIQAFVDQEDPPLILGGLGLFFSFLISPFVDLLY